MKNLNVKADISKLDEFKILAHSFKKILNDSRIDEDVRRFHYQTYKSEIAELKEE